MIEDLHFPLDDDLYIVDYFPNLCKVRFDHHVDEGPKYSVWDMSCFTVVVHRNEDTTHTFTLHSYWDNDLAVVKEKGPLRLTIPADISAQAQSEAIVRQLLDTWIAAWYDENTRKRHDSE